MNQQLQLATCAMALTILCRCATSIDAQTRRRGGSDMGYPGDGDNSTFPPDGVVDIPAAGSVGAIQCGSTMEGCGSDPSSCAVWTAVDEPPTDESLTAFEIGVTERLAGQCLWACPSGMAADCFPVPQFPGGAQLCANETGTLTMDDSSGVNLVCYSQDGTCSPDSSVPIDLIPNPPKFSGPDYSFCMGEDGNFTEPPLMPLPPGCELADGNCDDSTDQEGTVCANDGRENEATCVRVAGAPNTILNGLVCLECERGPDPEPPTGRMCKRIRNARECKDRGCRWMRPNPNNGKPARCVKPKNPRP